MSDEDLREDMRALDAWCNFGFRFLESLDRKSAEYVIALYALKRLTDRRVGR